MLVGKRSAHQLIFPYNKIKHSLTSFAPNSAFNGPNDFKFGTETYHIISTYRSLQNLGEVDHNLRYHIFYDVT